MTASTQYFPARSPRGYRISQVVLVITAGVLAVSAPFQIVMALAIPAAGMFVLTAILSLALILPLILMMSATPPITLSREGVTIQPGIGKPSTLTWASVTEIKPYSLMPPEDSETTRRLVVGRKKYRPAAGTMLVCEGLPWRYRVVGAFAGEGFKPVIAVTNRTHAEYDQFVYLLAQLRP